MKSTRWKFRRRVRHRHTSARRLLDPHTLRIPEQSGLLRTAGADVPTAAGGRRLARHGVSSSRNWDRRPIPAAEHGRHRRRRRSRRAPVRRRLRRATPGRCREVLRRLVRPQATAIRRHPAHSPINWFRNRDAIWDRLRARRFLPTGRRRLRPTRIQRRSARMAKSRSRGRRSRFRSGEPTRRSRLPTVASRSSRRSTAATSSTRA